MGKTYLNPEHLIFILFLLVLGIGISHHELWYDESLHWLLARDSGSIAEIFVYNRNEGHPILWPALLYALTRFTHDPLYMQILHLFISGLAFYIFLMKSPFGWKLKTLFVFGYFPLYEFSVISRNYSLVLLFFFICLNWISQVQKKYIWIGVLLVLMSNSHLFGGILACALVAVLTIDFIQEKKYKDNLLKSQFSWCLLLFGFGLTILLLQILPGSFHFELQAFEGSPIRRVGTAIISFLKGFVPVPDFYAHHSWNTNYLIEHHRSIGIGLTFLIGITSYICFTRKNLSLIFYAVGSIGILLFIFWIQKSHLRYAGFIYILFVGAYWLSMSPIQQRPALIIPRIERMPGIHKMDLAFLFLYMVLIIQVTGAVLMFSKDFQDPFSQSKNASEYLNKINLEQLSIAGYYCSCMPVSAYLGKQIYYPQIDNFAGYCKLRADDPQSEINTKVSFIDQVKEYALQSTSDLYLVLHRRLIDHNAPAENDIVYADHQIQISFLKAFEGSIIEREDYYIYKVVFLSSSSSIKPGSI